MPDQTLKILDLLVVAEAPPEGKTEAIAHLRGVLRLRAFTSPMPPTPRSPPA